MGRTRRALLVAERVLLGAHHALDHGVHALQVARVGGDGHGQRLARVRLVRAGGAQVVLHVARALRGVRVGVALELREDLGQRLADGVGQHVQAPAMGHADHGLLHARARGVVEDAVQQRDERLAALQREALVADVLRVQEALEALRLHQLLQDAPAGRRRPGRLRLRVDSIRSCSQSLRSGSAMYMYSTPMVAAVGVAQDLQDLAQRRAVLAGQAVGDELAVQVPQREAVGGGVQVRVRRARGVEGIEVGHQVAAHAVGVDELQDARLLLDLLVAARGPEEARGRRRSPSARAGAGRFRSSKIRS